MFQILEKLFKLNRFIKIILQITVDIIIVSLCYFSSYFLRLDDISFIYDQKFWYTLSFIQISSILIFYKLEFYKNIIRYLSLNFIKQFALGSILSTLLIYFFSVILISFLPRSVPIIYFFQLFIFLCLFRITIVYLHLIIQNNTKIPVAIYGASSSGKELLSSIEQSNRYELCFFIDDNKALHNYFISSKKVISREKSLLYIKKHKIKKIFIAIQNLSIVKKQEIFNFFSIDNLILEIIPSFTKIIDKRLSLDHLRPIKIEDLLGRAPVSTNVKDLKKVVSSKNILVTGAGGSIGSEICKQITKFKPKKLVLIDSSEFALYTIFNYLEKYNKDLQIIPILTNLGNVKSIEMIFKKHKLNLIYHAAAYKHVQLVENNILEALRNNVINTYYLLQTSIKFKVDQFTLISTDKAVKPKSIMGYSKKISELICQCFTHTKTNISIVRFGNVLGSSGSVIPKFEEQIKDGGPVTVTHPEATRYFMLISEAALLVLQTTLLTTGKEIFILDMGKPVKILNLAKLMIKLYGFQPTLEKQKFKKNKDFIPIIFSGLTSGEKLHEQLFNNNAVNKTLHPLIVYENMKKVSNTKIIMYCKQLEKSIENLDLTKTKLLLSKMKLLF